MVRTIYKVLLADILLLISEAWVVQDLQWRTANAASLHSACVPACGYTPSFSYTLLTQFFTMAGNGVSLTSPPTLDWIQALTLTLFVVNAWFAYTVLKSRRARPPEARLHPAP